MGIPVLGVAAFSGTGKTTLLEKIISELTDRGLKIAVVKHDAHGLTFDHEGKDSWRFSHAGAAYSIVSGPDQAAVFMRQNLQPEQAFKFVPDADIILVEGFKEGQFSQIGLNRVATGKGFTADITKFVAVVTDDDQSVQDAKCKGIPAFAFDDIGAICDFVQENMPKFTQNSEF